MPLWERGIRRHRLHVRRRRIQGDGFELRFEDLPERVCECGHCVVVQTRAKLVSQVDVIAVRKRNVETPGPQGFEIALVIRIQMTGKQHFYLIEAEVFVC